MASPCFMGIQLDLRSLRQLKSGLFLFLSIPSHSLSFFQTMVLSVTSKATESLWIPLNNKRDRIN